MINLKECNHIIIKDKCFSDDYYKPNSISETLDLYELTAWVCEKCGKIVVVSDELIEKWKFRDKWIYKCVKAARDNILIKLKKYWYIS